MSVFLESLGFGPEKTLKREVAFAGWVFWWVITFIMFNHHDRDLVAALVAPYGIATTAAWGFVAQAYGMDWWGKQRNGQAQPPPPEYDPSTEPETYEDERAG